MTDERGGSSAGPVNVSAIDPTVCPLCGGPNVCGAAAGAESCWCAVTTIPAEVLAQIPAEYRDRACICARCATGTNSPGDASTRPVGLD